MERCVGFAPSVDENCTTLILGSMPSVKSLEQNQYYAHPQNRFWKLMAIFFNDGVIPSIYEQRLQMLRKNHIALWDSIDSCVREGSLDSAICDEVANDFTAFLEKYPNIVRICFNGGKSFQCFKKYNKEVLKNPKIQFFKLPSTSPANARFRLADLQEKWQEALQEHIDK
jgi:hypoxanthine-DNA glycosylase